MPNKAVRILESIKKIAGEEIHNKILKACGTIEEKPTPIKQAEYIKAVLDELGNNCGAEIAEEVMTPCGHHCISEATINKARDLYQKSENMEDFLKLLNEQHIGGGKLHIDNGKIIGIYSKCYCGIAKQAKELSVSYCSCSAGWFERLFSSVLGRKVEVKRLQTILGGAEQCIFEIYAGDLNAGS